MDPETPEPISPAPIEPSGEPGAETPEVGIASLEKLIGKDGVSFSMQGSGLVEPLGYTLNTLRLIDVGELTALIALLRK